MGDNAAAWGDRSYKRLAACTAFEKYAGTRDIHGNKFAALLGLLNYRAIIAWHETNTSEAERVFDALLGEHGYAVYKMLLARKGAS